jgi:hypothetical protein
MPMALRPTSRLIASVFPSFVLLLVWCSVVPSITLADSLTTSAQTTTVLFTGPLTSPPQIPPGSISCSPVSSVASGVTSSTCGATMASGVLSTGTVGATAQASTTSTNVLRLDTSSAAVDYSLSASGPCPGSSCTITNGTLVVTLSSTFNGSVTATGCTLTGPSPNCASFADIVIPSTESFVGLGGSTSLYLQNGTSSFSISTPLMGGTADFSFTLNASAQCYDASSCTSIADALDPVNITGASVYGSTGSLISGATVISQSGFNPNAIPTPEPSSLVLLGTGLLALVGIAKFN